LPSPAGAPETPGFSCWKQCGSLNFRCSWPHYGPAGNTSYLLTLCYAKRGQCQHFQAGTRTTYPLNHRLVYVLTNTTAWVEARWGDHLHRTPNLTLCLNEAVKPDPPDTGMPFTKTGGQLRLRVPWPPCHQKGRPPQREARFQRMGGGGWTQVKTSCAGGRDGTFEVQLRHKLPYWSSYWSDWSSSIFIPEEILVSPELSYHLGKLGRDGQRELRLGWQRAPEEQGNITYTLHARMLACDCTGLDEEDTVVLGTEVTAHNLTLSGAEYEILLTAANAAGPGPAGKVHVPAEQRADLRFEDISVAGSTVTARWEAPSPGSFYCFEQQPLPREASERGVCIHQDFPAKSIHVERGKGAPHPSLPPHPRAGSWWGIDWNSRFLALGVLETSACYRLAVHGWAPARGWSTFALQHHYASNDSLAVPIHINASAKDVTLQWSPSPRATCPGVLAKYLICHKTKGDNVTYAEADATASHFTLQNIRPGTAYGVGVWEVTAESRGTCSIFWHFQTKALGALWNSNLMYLGILLVFPAMAIVYQLSKKRARHLLFPPLPKPMGTKAIQFSTGDTKQGQPQPGFVEPSERFSPAELLITELDPGKEGADTSNGDDTPQPSPVAKEPVLVCPSGCEKELPFTYRRQEVLSPVGFPLPGSTSCSGHQIEEEEEEEKEKEEEEGRWGLHQPLVPIALLISDKPIIIRDEEGWDPSPEKSLL
ncbi:I12R1 protein, partial [Rostratula benghalensis]|nr:I12R1 protein [Rostratula benghalensis]